MIILFGITSFLLGVLMFPALMFLRARRSKEWDDSNLLNIYRVVAHLMIRPGDFGHMYYNDGRKPFWYISKDEFSDVVQTNHNDGEKQ